MKRIGLLLILVIMSLAAVACSSETSGGVVIHGLKPSDIPVKYIQAKINKDYKTLNELLLEKEEDLLELQEYEQKNDKVLEKYGLIQWAFDNDTYYYLLEYINPQDNLLHKEDFKIIKTQDGWKKDSYGDTANFQQIVSKLENNKKVLRELNAK